ncbi:uncharacterized protein [Apostichopus japonicus]|uniref:uncharacterized protein n=1 Tax=Stichopus japonicus TaxID=307972 RepID=UPI003AB65A86
MEMMSLNAPGMFLGGHPFLGGGAFAGNYIPAFHHPVVYRPNIPTLDTPAQFFMQRNPTSNSFLGGHQLYRTSSIPGRIYPIEPAIDPGAVVLAEFDHPSSFRGPIA